MAIAAVTTYSGERAGRWRWETLERTGRKTREKGRDKKAGRVFTYVIRKCYYKGKNVI